MYDTMLDRFIRYAKVNTRSDATSQTYPSTENQVAFMKNVLIPDLQALGLEDVTYDEETAFVTATLPATAEGHPTIGFIAHVDTADYPADKIQPQVHPDYDGDDLLLNEDLDIWMRLSDFPNLKNYVGQTMITTDGTTLLGADDKAGIVSIIEAVKSLKAQEGLEHGTVRLAFGPDEEIGKGAYHFDVESFNADFAYTLDSGVVGKFEYETFNAAQIDFTIKGRLVHPGTAKGRMINALHVAAEIVRRLPEGEVPEQTAGYEGFFMVSQQVGTMDQVEMSIIIRDHDQTLFEERKALLEKIVADINSEYDVDPISYDLYDQYFNMRSEIEKDMSIVDRALDAYRYLGIEPDVQPFRGGTDGSIITAMGLPTPNIFTGGENFHGQYEFISLEAMATAADVVQAIVLDKGPEEK